MVFHTHTCQGNPTMNGKMLGCFRDAPLDFQGGRKFSEKKFPLAMNVKKKFAPVRGRKKILSSPGKVTEKKIPPPLGGEKKIHPYSNFLPPWKSTCNSVSLTWIQ